jgi:endoplasmic reticulum-Golgi intermediate compartment protein 3
LKEYFADYAPLLPSLFSLNHTPTSTKPLYGSSTNTWDPDALERSIQGINAVLLSLKKKPVIRYEKMSTMAKKLASEVQVCRPAFFFHVIPTSFISIECNQSPRYLTLG